jgi:hypothetical protein
MRPNLRHNTFSVISSILVVVGVVASACSSREPNAQFVAGVQSQVQVPRDMKTVQIRVTRGGQDSWCKVYNVEKGVVQLPQTLGTIREGEETNNAPVEIAVVGYDTKSDSDVADCKVIPTQSGNGARILRRSVQPYVKGRQLYVPMPLKYSCFDNICPDSSQTCKGGVCVDATVDSNKLVEFDSSLVDGKGSDCFRLNKKPADVLPACLDGAAPPKVIDDKNCIFEALELPGARGVNVEVTFEGGVAREVLDLDPQEGFELINGLPRQFKLAPGLCRSWQIGTGRAPQSGLIKAITSMQVATNCVPKTALQPICAPDQEFLSYAQGVNRPVKSLTAVKGSIVLVVEASSENQDAFKTGGPVAKLAEAASLAPMPGKLEVSMVFAEPSANACVKSDADVEVKLSAADATQMSLLQVALNKQVGQSLGVPTATTGVGLDRALTLAYNSLKSKPRGAVVVLANGKASFAAQCDSTAGVFALANDAKANFKTHVVATGSAPDTSAADKLANAGDTFPAVKNADALAATGKFADVIAELTTCRYSKPADIESNAPNLHYVVPGVVGDTKIASVASCTGSADGFVMAGNELQLCKNSCDALVKATKEVALKAVAAGAPLQGIDMLYEYKR